MFQSTKDALGNFLNTQNKNNKLLVVNNDNIDLISTSFFLVHPDVADVDGIIKIGYILTFDDNGKVNCIVGVLKKGTKSSKRIIFINDYFIAHNDMKLRSSGYGSSKEKSNIISLGQINKIVADHFDEYFVKNYIFKFSKNSTKDSKVKTIVGTTVAKNILEAKNKVTFEYDAIAEVQIEEINEEIKKLQSEIDVIQKRMNNFLQIKREFETETIKKDKD